MEVTRLNELKLKTTALGRQWMRNWSANNVPVGGPYFPNVFDDIDTLQAEVKRLQDENEQLRDVITSMKRVNDERVLWARE